MTERQEIPIYRSGTLNLAETFPVIDDEDGLWVTPDVAAEWERLHLAALELYGRHSSRDVAGGPSTHDPGNSAAASRTVSAAAWPPHLLIRGGTAAA
jgi:hypothetical protein